MNRSTVSSQNGCLCPEKEKLTNTPAIPHLIVHCSYVQMHISSKSNAVQRGWMLWISKLCSWHVPEIMGCACRRQQMVWVSPFFGCNAQTFKVWGTFSDSNPTIWRYLEHLIQHIQRSMKIRPWLDDTGPRVSKYWQNEIPHLNQVGTY